MTLALVLAETLLAVTGMVTFVSHEHANSGILQPCGRDGLHRVGEMSRPMWFAGERNAEVTSTLTGTDRLRPGDRVVVAGACSGLGFAPGLTAKTITYLEHGALPSAGEVTLNDLAWGGRDNERVALTGVVTSVKPQAGDFVRLSVATPQGDFAAEAPADLAPWSELVDAEVRLAGSAMSLFNVRGEFIGVLQEIVEPSGVQVIAPAGDPFARLLTPIDRLLPYCPGGPDLHRRHVKGVVTYANPGAYFYLAEDEATLKVCSSATEVKPGDEVEAVGFVGKDSGLGVLESATVRVVGKGTVPAPVKVGFVELEGYPMLPSGRFACYDGRLVTWEGRLSSFVPTGSGATLVVTGEDDIPVTVALDGRRKGGRRDGDPRVHEGANLTAEDITWGPNVRVTGVLELHQAPGVPQGQMPAILGWTLHASDPSAIEVLHDAAWRAHRAARWWRSALSVLAVAALFALVFLLRNLLRLRATRKRQEILTTERKRMAADLHDTLEQHLAGARMVLNSAVSFTPDVPDGVKTAVAQANDLLAQAKSEMRARILDMRSDVLFTETPVDLLRGLAARLNAHGLVRVRTLLRGLPERLSPSVAAEMVAIIQEAVTNAVKHGHAKNIVLATDPVDAVHFRLTVANDGAPFDAAAVLGPEAGHYGLIGMRERAHRADISLTFEPEGRWMTVRLIVSRKETHA